MVYLGAIKTTLVDLPNIGNSLVQRPTDVGFTYLDLPKPGFALKTYDLHKFGLAPDENYVEIDNDTYIDYLVSGTKPVFPDGYKPKFAILGTDYGFDFSEEINILSSERGVIQGTVDILNIPASGIELFLFNKTNNKIIASTKSDGSGKYKFNVGLNPNNDYLILCLSNSTEFNSLVKDYAKPEV